MATQSTSERRTFARRAWIGGCVLAAMATACASPANDSDPADASAVSGQDTAIDAASDAAIDAAQTADAAADSAENDASADDAASSPDADADADADAGGHPGSCANDDDCKALAAADPCGGPRICDKTGAFWQCTGVPGGAVTCAADDNVCTAEACEPSTGACASKPANSGLGCSDGDACTLGDICSEGVCVGGPSICACSTNADCAAFEDGDACNGTLICNTTVFPSVCAINAATVVQCNGDADGPCEKTSCDATSGQCTAKALDDGGDCTQAGACLQSSCQAGACVEGTTNLCDCKKDSDCSSKEDGDQCNGTLYCELSSGDCKVNPATIVVCPASGDAACIKSVCLPGTGACQLTPTEYLDEVCTGEGDAETCQAVLAKPGSAAKKIACEDGDACTLGDLCSKGVCQKGATNTCACQQDADCAKLEDGNSCNGKLFCNPQVSQCQLNPASTVSCPSVDDGDCVKNACLPKTGVCQPTHVEFVDVICVKLSDGKQQCRSEVQAAIDPAKLGLPCDDGDPCSAATTCKGGSCGGGTDTCKCSDDADCKGQDDGNLCNGLPYCDKVSGTCKANSALTVVCKTVDNTDCTKLACHPQSGECIATAAQEAKLVCAAGDSDCRWEVKAPGEPMPLVACDDGEACTSNDVCVGGVCQGGKSICECQIDADCEGKDDGDKCNGTFYCDKSGGKAKCTFNAGAVVVCGQQPSDPCVVKACDPKTGVCGLKAANEGKNCDDGDDCTANDACSGGSCGGNKANCDDNDVCTADACKAGVGCVHTKANCDDGNACTLDICDAKTGACSLDDKALAGKACEADGNPCTAGDACSAGACKAGPNVVCTLPTKPCEDAKCIAAASGSGFQCVVVAKADGATCSDDAGCTVGATCQAGSCAAGNKQRLMHVARGVDGWQSQLHAVAPLPEGLAIAVGGAFQGEAAKPSASAWWIAKLDRAGSSLYPASVGKGAELTFGSDVADVDARAYAVAVREDGSAVVAGAVRDTTALLNAQVIALDAATGVVQWQEQVGTQQKDEVALAMAVQPGGAVVIAGWQQKPGGQRTPWAARMTAAGGFVWQSTAPLFAGGGVIAAAHLGAEGATILVGTSGVGSAATGRLIGILPDGKASALDATFQPAGGITLAGVAAASDGWLLVGSTTAEGGASVRAAWLRVDSKGALRWLRAAKVQSHASAALAHGDGWLIGGSTNPSGGDNDGWLSAIDGYGNGQWQRSVDGGATDVVAALAPASDGDVLAVGRRDASDGANAGLFVRSDAFGHTSCTAAGTCVGKKGADCDDQKACTADDCNAVAGCAHVAVDDFVCDPDDGCSIDGVCAASACKPAANGKLFVRGYENDPGWNFNGMLARKDGGMATLAAQGDFEGKTPRKVWLLRLDAAGELQSKSEIYSHNGQGNGFHPVRAYTLLERADGGFMAGIGHGYADGSKYIPHLLGLASDGTVQWDKTPPYNTCSLGVMQALASYPSGDVLDVRSCPDGYQNRTHSYVIRRNNSGEAMWAESGNGRFYVEGADIALHDGLIVGKDTAWVAGSIFGGKDIATAHHSATVVAFDGGGALLWQKVLGETASTAFVALEATAQGAIVAAGWREVAGVRRVLLIGLGAKGNPLWRHSPTTGAQTTPTAIVALNDSALMLAGIQRQGLLDQTWLGRYDAVGNFEQDKTVTLGTSAEASWHGLAALKDDTVVLSGVASVAGKTVGLIARADRWGHVSCTNSAGCLLKSAVTCSDGDACTVDTCSAGACKHGPGSCGDGNPCTTDACTGKTCNNGPTSCDDGDACTADVCDPLEGCVHLAIPGCTASSTCSVPVCDVKGCDGMVLAGQCYDAELKGIGLFSVASKACADSGRTLLSVHNAATNILAVDLARAELGGKNVGVWLGLTKQSGTAPWQWQDGSSVDYSGLSGYAALSVTDAQYGPKAVAISVSTSISNSGYWSPMGIDNNSALMPVCIGLPKATCSQQALADGTGCGDGKSCKAGQCLPTSP